MDHERTYTAFAGSRRIAAGDLRTTLLRTREHFERDPEARLLVFDDHDGSQLEFDLRGTPEQVLARLTGDARFTPDEQPAPRSGPGRPRLGVVCREVSLLPRHWEWLAQQPGGSSVALRKLVDEARRRGQGKHLARTIRDGASKFMWAMAGDLPNFEEASRALFAGDAARLSELMRHWPPDVRDHVERRVAAALRLEREAATMGDHHAPAHS
jgi:hypothetical protein